MWTLLCNNASVDVGQKTAEQIGADATLQDWITIEEGLFDDTAQFERCFSAWLHSRDWDSTFWESSWSDLETSFVRRHIPSRLCH